MKYVFCLLIIMSMGACQSKMVDNNQSMSVRMMDSEMKRFPELWFVDSVRIPFWGYTHGMIAKASLDMYEVTKDQKYFDYVQAYTDTLVKENGLIVTYDSSKHNIDMINPGKILFSMHEHTGDQRLMEAATTLRKAMKGHPRTSEGGFWHKKKYEHQMWLDGLYMGAPFLAAYAKFNNEPALFDDVANQIALIHKYAFDSSTSLYYHGWDESKSMHWANPETGTSASFWGRAIGWYAMALVDLLDFMPENHPSRPGIIKVLNHVAKGVMKYQDKKSGVWYQVVDQGDRAGNYLESTASCMFVYSLFKGVRKGYLDQDFLEVAKDGYQGIIDHFIREEPDGTVSLTRCCKVAGLGGKRMRDGSFDYYINEEIRDNDPKGVAPFIWASIEYEILSKEKIE